MILQKRRISKKQVIKKTTTKTCIYIIMISVAVMCLFPIWALIVNATRSTAQIRQGMSLIPGEYLMDNMQSLIDKQFPIVRAFFNSAFIAITSTILGLYFSAMTAFALTIYDIKFKKIIYGFIIGIMLVPGQLGMIGFYKVVIDLGIYDTYIPLIIPAIASAGTVFFLKQYMEGNLSFEMVEASRIDGASEIRLFHMIIIPLIKPALATMGIFGIIASWNNFMGPLMLISSRELYTLPMLVEELKTDIYATDYGSMYLGITLTILPPIIFYMIFSKSIIKGISLGGVKE